MQYELQNLGEFVVKDFQIITLRENTYIHVIQFEKSGMFLNVNIQENYACGQQICKKIVTSDFR